MRSLLLLLLPLLSMSATAQANQQQLGVVISPDYTSRTYTTAGTFQGTTI